jgi:hypothetical protein
MTRRISHDDRRNELSHRKPRGAWAVFASVDDEHQRGWIMNIGIATPFLLSAVVLPYDPGPRLPIEIGVSRVAYQSAYVGPPVGRIGYEQRRVRIWEEKPYKRPRYRDGDDRDWRH